MSQDAQLQILIDVRARLDELTKAQHGLHDTAKEANSLGAAFKTGLGIEIARRGVALITRSFQESVVAAFEMAGAIKDQAENLEMSTDAYQVLGEVMKEAGGSMELMSQMIAINNRSLSEARNISSGAAAAYRQLELDSAKLESVPVEVRMEMIGKAILGAKDKTVAFGAASTVLGSRNLPTMLGALKSLSTDGYDHLAAAAKAAGLVMENETVMTLDRAEKQIEKFRRALAIASGQVIAQSLQQDPALITDLSKGVLKGVGAFLNFGRGIGTTLANSMNAWAGRDMVSYDEIASKEAQANDLMERARAVREAAERKQREVAAAVAQKQQTDMANAEMYLKMAQAAAQVSGANPFATEEEKRKSRIFWLTEEINRRQRLYDLIKNAPPDNEPPQQRSLKLDEQYNGMEAARRELDALQRGIRRPSRQGGTAVRLLDAQDESANRESPNLNRSYLGLGEGAKVGALDYANQLGSQGEQVAAAMQNSIGATVSAISEGIYGWITGTQSFGDVLRNLGSTILQTLLQTIVQMGVQWMISAAVAKVSMLSISVLGFGLRKAEAADVIATETAKKPAIMSNAAGSSVSSFGLAAVLGIAALLAVMAIFGGFSAGGYTGNGAVNEPRGIAHAGEVIFSQRNVADWGGAAALDRLRVAGPSSIAPTSAPSLLPAGAVGAVGANASGSRGQNVHVYLDKSAYFEAIRSDVSGIAHEVYEKKARS